MSVLATNYLTPTGREEAWRFTPLSRFAGLHDGTSVISSVESLIARDALPAGVTASRISRELVSSVSQSEDVIVQRVHAEAETMFHLQIAPSIELSEPIHLKRKQMQVGQAELSRVRITVGQGARAIVIVENDGEVILGEDIEIILEQNSYLKFVTLQEWSAHSVYAARHHAIIDRDATFESVTVTVGGSLVRILPTVEFKAPGSSAELLGVYFATAGQHFEHRIHVDHAVPKAKSRVNYKGALSGNEAHTVWIGDVLIRAAAEGTDTYELNRNLLLSDGARADSVPNLEIETGEIVGAGHASTTGRFDDEQLFYLMSRGVPMDEARRLVVRGFFAEIISHINDEAIQERLMVGIDGELAKVGE
ncbi:MAG: Fe-S cluster assembly protein SufD [Streptomycetaceae bacterium]|nr:MAG: Fe-S cluster assembly protein SufD [Streptomycetaceae bacterium]